MPKPIHRSLAPTLFLVAVCSASALVRPSAAHAQASGLTPMQPPPPRTGLSARSTCPTDLPGTSIFTTPIGDGVELLFLAPRNANEMRSRVRALVRSHQRRAAAAAESIVPLPPEPPAPIATVYDIDGGAMLKLTPRDANQLADVQAHALEYAQRLAGDSCILLRDTPAMSADRLKPAVSVGRASAGRHPARHRRSEHGSDIGPVAGGALTGAGARILFVTLATLALAAPLSCRRGTRDPHEGKAPRQQLRLLTRPVQAQAAPPVVVVPVPQERPPNAGTDCMATAQETLHLIDQTAFALCFGAGSDAPTQCFAEALNRTNLRLLDCTDRQPVPLRELGGAGGLLRASAAAGVLDRRSTHGDVQRRDHPAAGGRRLRSARWTLTRCSACAASASNTVP